MPDHDPVLTVWLRQEDGSFSRVGTTTDLLAAFAMLHQARKRAKWKPPHGTENGRVTQQGRDPNDQLREDQRLLEAGRRSWEKRRAKAKAKAQAKLAG